MGKLAFNGTEMIVEDGVSVEGNVGIVELVGLEDDLLIEPQPNKKNIPILATKIILCFLNGTPFML